MAKKLGGRLADRDWLVTQYVDLERSANDIARELGCAVESVRYRLLSYGVFMRSNNTSKCRIDTQGRECTKCGEYKLWAEFWNLGNMKNPRPGPGGTRSGRCTTCTDRHPQYHREYAWLKRFNLTPVQYWAMYEAQGGLCALCGQPERARHQSGKLKLLAVDHDRRCCPGAKSCGTCVRGLLCFACNVVLGRLERGTFADRLPAYREARPLGIAA